MRFSIAGLVLALALVGCASAPEPLPSSTYFQQMDVVTPLPDVRPVELPPAPDKTFMVLNGEEAVAFVGPEADKLNEYVKALQANTEIAKLSAQVLALSEIERRALIEAGRATEQSRNLLGAEVARLQGQLNHSELMRDIQGWAYWVLLIASLAIGL